MSYQLTKPEGHLQKITLSNSDTGRTIILGQISMEILSILKELEGIDIGRSSPDPYIRIYDEWKFNIKEDTAKALAKTTIPTRKPVRVKKEKSEQPAPEKKTKTINLMDILLEDEE